MPRRFLVFALAALCAGAALVHGQGAQTGRLLVISKGDRTVSVVDPATLRVLGKVPSGEDPHEVAASADGRVAYVSNYGAGRGGLNTFTVGDLVGFKPLPPVDLGGLRGPHGMMEAGGKIYFTAEVAKAVGRYDPAARQIDLIIGTGQDITHMVVVSKDLKRIYTVNVRSATASIIESTTLAAAPVPGPPPGRGGRGGRGGLGRFAPGADDWTVTSVRVGEPIDDYEGFDVSPDDRELWTASPRTGEIAIVDVPTKTLKEKVPAGATGANRVKFTPDGRLVLVSRLSFNPAAATGGSIFVFDAATRKVIKQIDAGPGVGGILMQPDGARAYVASSRDNLVRAIDLKTLTVVGTVDVGPNPDGLAWTVTP